MVMMVNCCRMASLLALAVFTAPRAGGVVASPAGSLRGRGQQVGKVMNGMLDTTTARSMPDKEYPDEGTYEHIGCFKDSTEDRVLGHNLEAEDMTPTMCLDHCNMQSAAYMATQYAVECWCAVAGAIDYQRHGVGVCDMYCGGDSEETCGGYKTFDLYRLDWPAASTDSEYMECYADSVDDRVMGDVLEQDDMTSSVCRDHCEDKNAMYYATQWGNECWCGTSSVFADYERHGEGVCHSGCAGDKDVACGGHEAFSLFRFMDDAPNEVSTPSPVTDPTPSPVADSSLSPVADPTPSPVAASTFSPVADPIPSPVADSTPSPVADPTPSPVAASTLSPVADLTPSPVADSTPSPVADPIPSPVADSTPSPVADPTPSPVAASTVSPVADLTPSPVADSTPSPVADPTPSPVANSTPSPVADPTPSPVANSTLAPVADLTPSPVANSTLSPVADPTPSPVADSTLSPVADPTPSPVADSTLAPVADLTPSPVANSTPSPAANPTLSPIADPTASPVADPIPSPVAEPTPSPVAASTVSPVADLTPSPVADSTPSPVADPIPSPVADSTPSPVADPTPSPVANSTLSPVADLTPSPVANSTLSPVADPTPSPVADSTLSPVADLTPSPVANSTPSPAANPTLTPIADPTTSPVADPTPSPVDQPTDNGGGGKQYGETFSGDGTYYGYTTVGNCAISEPIPSMYDGMTPVAIYYAEGDSQMCGACIEGTASGNGSGSTPIESPFKAYVSDKCPECASSDLDFAKSGDGRWDIEWHFVECSGGGDPEFVFEVSSSSYWKIQARGTKTPVEELKVSGHVASRTDDNFFIAQEGSPYHGAQAVETRTIGGVFRSTSVAS